MRAGNVSCKTSILQGGGRADFITLGERSVNRAKVQVPFSEEAYASNSSLSEDKDYSCGDVDARINGRRQGSKAKRNKRKKKTSN